MKFRALAFGLCGICMLNPLSARESAPPPCGSPVTVPDKPALEDYPDYSDFLLQVMQYKQANRDQAAHQAACPQDYQPEPEASSDPTVIDQPETLDSALARTERLSPIDYQRNRTWYNRSTSQSFGLSDAGTDELADSLILTSLQTIENTTQDSADQGVNVRGATGNFTIDPTWWPFGRAELLPSCLEGGSE